MRELEAADAGALSTLLLGQRAEYLRHFHPFAFDAETLATELGRRIRDRWWGIWVASRLAGFFMMRGLDAGYARPAFGVFVAEEFAGQGLASRALDRALEWGAKAGVEAVMLTVAAENAAARRIYEGAGFRPTGRLAPSGQEIYERIIP